MKLVSLFRRFSRGIRMPALALIAIMTLAMWMCVSMYGKLNYTISDLLNFGGSAMDNTAFFQAIKGSIGAANTGKDDKYIEKTVQKVAQDDRVEAVLPALTLPRAKFNGKSITMIVYSPEMTKHMKGLVRYGVDFSENPDGCIVSGEVFQGYQAGDNVGVFVGEETIPIPVAGRLKAPYRYMSFTKYSNVLNVSDLYAGDEDANVVIMQATENVINNIISQAGRTEMQRNFIVVFKNGVSKEQQQAVAAEHAPPWEVYSFERVIDNSWDVTYNKLKQEMPFPLFMIFAATVAYLSVSFLIFKRKEKDLAVIYLSGCSKFKCAALMFFTFTLIALIPITINSLIVYFWPRPWRQLLNDLVYYALINRWNMDIWGVYAQDMRMATTELKLDSGSYVVILIFYGITVLIAMLTTFFAMRKHSPLTYLRGVNE